MVEEQTVAGRGPALSLGEVAALTGGEVQGEGDGLVRGVAPLADAAEDELGLVAAGRYLKEAAASRAGAFLVSRELAPRLTDDRPRVVVGDAHAALVPLLDHFHPPRLPPAGIHPTAILGRGVVLGEGVSLGPAVVLEDGVEVGDGVRIGPHAVVGRGCRIGADTVLHANVTLYPGARLGARVIVHAGARIGVDGFGYAFVEGAHLKIPQVGGCVVEDDVEIGANVCIDRGSIGDTVVGRGSKLDNLVHLAHNVRLGPGCALAAQVGIAGSSEVGAGVLFGGQSGASGHVRVGEGARVAAKTGVIRDVPPGTTVVGFPARERSEFMKAVAHTYRLGDLVERLSGLEAEVARLKAVASSVSDTPPPGG